jgi:hypothetical protein
MNSTNILLAKLLVSLSALLSLLGGHAAPTATTFGAGVGSSYTGLAAIAPNPTINAPVCPIATSNLDSSVGLNTCPGLKSIWVATTTYPLVALTLGPIGSTTSTTSTTLSFNAGSSSTQPLNLGDACSVFLSSAPTTPFDLSANITNGSTTTSTSTVTLANLNSAAVTINTTSTAGSIYASSTLKVTCFDTTN